MNTQHYNNKISHFMGMNRCRDGWGLKCNVRGWTGMCVQFMSLYRSPMETYKMKTIPGSNLELEKIVI